MVRGLEKDGETAWGRHSGAVERGRTVGGMGLDVNGPRRDFSCLVLFPSPLPQSQKHNTGLVKSVPAKQQKPH